VARLGLLSDVPVGQERSASTACYFRIAHARAIFNAAVHFELVVQRGLLLKAGTVVDATLIPAPTSTKNKDKASDADMHSSKKGNPWHFGIKAHIGGDAESGLVHTVRATSGNVHDVTEGNSLLHG
jgi:IS5 family transposase